MADANRITQKIYNGLGKAAERLGLPYALYRPTDPLLPISANSLIGPIMASFNAQDWKYVKPNLYGKALWYGCFNGNLTNPGDYLIGAEHTMFIAAMQTHLSILCVECNLTVSVQRQNITNKTSNAPLTLISGLPVSMLEMAAGGGKVDGPDNIGQGKYKCLMPDLGVYINTNYTLLDELGQSYLIYSSELTDLGWRLIVERIRS